MGSTDKTRTTIHLREVTLLDTSVPAPGSQELHVTTRDPRYPANHKYHCPPGDEYVVRDCRHPDTGGVAARLLQLLGWELRSIRPVDDGPDMAATTRCCDWLWFKPPSGDDPTAEKEIVGCMCRHTPDLEIVAAMLEGSIGPRLQTAQAVLMQVADADPGEAGKTLERMKGLAVDALAVWATPLRVVASPKPGDVLQLDGDELWSRERLKALADHLAALNLMSAIPRRTVIVFGDVRVTQWPLATLERVVDAARMSREAISADASSLVMEVPDKKAGPAEDAPADGRGAR